MINTVYENTVLESKLTNLIDSKLEVKALMTVDKSLAENAGLKKVINRYVYEGEVEALESGQQNSTVGILSFTPQEYTVKRYQQTFMYDDMEVMQDPGMIDIALEGMADVMANQIRDEYFDELMKSTNRHTFEGDDMSYSDVVDALAMLNREVEDGLFIIMSPSCRRSIRKDSDFLAARSGEIAYTGQFGTLCGIPALFSSKVPEGMAIITDKNAIRFFVKKDASLEQDRDISAKLNMIVYERCGLIALVDDTSTIVLGKAAPTFTVTVTSGVISVSGRIDDTHDVYYRKSTFAALLGEDVTSWKKWDGITKILNSNGETYSFAEADENGKCVASVTCVVA